MATRLLLPESARKYLARELFGLIHRFALDSSSAKQ
jgi:hypothetical protein